VDTPEDKATVSIGFASGGVMVTEDCAVVESYLHLGCGCPLGICELQRFDLVIISPNTCDSKVVKSGNVQQKYCSVQSHGRREEGKGCRGGTTRVGGDVSCAIICYS
jgi:hypothetical protein